jgi:hypothetical protein
MFGAGFDVGQSKKSPLVSHQFVVGVALYSIKKVPARLFRPLQSPVSATYVFKSSISCDTTRIDYKSHPGDPVVVDHTEIKEYFCPLRRRKFQAGGLVHSMSNAKKVDWPFVPV